MTREEAKNNLIALGIEEPTQAQITNYLNQLHANSPKAEPQQQQPKKVDTPKEPDEPKNDQNEEIAKLQEQIKQLTEDGIRKDILAYAASKGLSGDNADKILAGFQNNLELAKTAIDSMSTIISEKETAAAIAKEKEIADNSQNPGSAGAGGEGEEEKPDDVLNAESIKFATVDKSAQSAQDYYK